MISTLPEPTIDVCGLQKSLSGREILRDITFQAHKAQIVGFLGPNGAGKTTTLRILTTYLTPDRGSVLVAGADVTSQALEVRRQIGYMPQTPPLYDDMTVTEYLSFIAAARGVARGHLNTALARVIERCALGDKRNFLCGKLSHGYRQRVGVAQAIIHEPAVIILDEPTNGLDPEQTLGMRGLISTLGKKSTVLFSTHLLSEVNATCTNIVIIHEGQVVKAGTMAELTRNAYLEEVFLECVGAASKPEVLRAGNV